MAKQRRFVLSIRSLLVATLAVAFCLAWLHYATRGRLMLESETTDPLLTYGRSCFVVLPVQSDRSEFQAGVRTKLDRLARKQGFASSTVQFSEVDVEGYDPSLRFLAVHYDGWVRYHFDVWELRYVYDYADPDVVARNKMVLQAILDVAKSFRS